MRRSAISNLVYLREGVTVFWHLFSHIEYARASAWWSLGQFHTFVAFSTEKQRLYWILVFWACIHFLEPKCLGQFISRKSSGSVIFLPAKFIPEKVWCSTVRVYHLNISNLATFLHSGFEFICMVVLLLDPSAGVISWIRWPRYR